MPDWFVFGAAFVVLAYALVGGVFLAFSDFIMRALVHTSGTGGIEAMQAINREVFRWLFMALFLGLAPVSLLIAGYGFVWLTAPAAPMISLAGLVYLIGGFGVTVVFNVPMNQALARMDPGADATGVYWRGTYVPRWTFWNTIRATACVVASALLLFALISSLQAQTA